MPVWRPAFQAVRATSALNSAPEVGTTSFRVGLRVKRQVRIGLKRHPLCQGCKSLGESSVLVSGEPAWRSARIYG